jgi:hypothetical protein
LALIWTLYWTIRSLRSESPGSSPFGFGSYTLNRNKRPWERLGALVFLTGKALDLPPDSADNPASLTQGGCAMTHDFDPFKPTFAILCSRNSSDLLQDAVNASGLDVEWPTLDRRSNHSHTERIRAFKQPILDAYETTEGDKKGPVAQNLVKYLWSRPRLDIRHDLRDTLSGIGWTITDDGNLLTQDALISEQFFPAGTLYDAYVAIREVLAQAKRSVTLIDAYIGSDVFQRLAAIDPKGISVRLLTTSKNIRPDLRSEASSFQSQYGVQVEIRITSDFHDRFIIIDAMNYYHIGASIKDAGKRAFLISKLQDEAVVSALKAYFDQAWRSATPA